MAATTPYSRKEIDTELLIDLVKSRPALYDKTIKEYNNREVRTELWEEITSILFSDSWQQMTKTAKVSKAAEVLKRWNNIRTAFTRDLKMMRDPTVSKTKKYIYFDKLTYLMDVTTDHVFETTDIETEEPKTEQPKTEEQRTERRIKRKSLVKHSYTTDNLKRTTMDATERERRSREGRQIENKRISEFDLDCDTNFALSLIPSLKCVPLDKKIDAQIEVLSVLKKYTSLMSEEPTYVVKYERTDPLTSECNDSEISGDDDY